MPSLYDDDQLALRLKTRFLLANNLAGVLGAAGVNNFVGAGAVSQLECTLAASELTGYPMTEADEVYHFEPLWSDLDTGYDIKVRPWFIHAAAAADTGLIFKFFYKLFAVGDSLVDAVAGTEATIVVPNSTGHTCNANDDSVEATAWTSIAFTTYYAAGDVAWAFALEFDTNGDASNDEVELMGIEFQYVPTLMTGNQTAGIREKT